MNMGNTLILDAFWVDNKPFPTEERLPNSNDIARAFYDYYSGNARHLGWMDLVQLREIIKKHNINHIVLQNLGTLGKISNIAGEVKVCVAYNYKLSSVVSSVSKSKDLVHCEPIYESVELGGWDFSEDADKIPFRAQHYIQYLLVRTRVDSITCMTNKVKFTAYFDDQGRVKFETEPNS